MNRIQFSKFHGFGNDYIVVEEDQVPEATDISDLTIRMCRRNTGVGGDGIALLEKLDGTEADFSCRIINPDGSEAGFSGNGTRCAVAHLYFHETWSGEHLKLKTKSGVKIYEFLSRNGNEFWYRAELGKPQFKADQIPFVEDSAIERFTNYELPLENQQIQVTVLNVGNPVCAIFVDDFTLDWREIGAEIESHEKFPERTNVVFIRPQTNNHIEIRIWERGAGETSSSGTCSIAAAVASAVSNKTDRHVYVHAPGGVTEAIWRDDEEMLITGSAKMAFVGEWVEDS